jgi:hypothetical protein
MLGIEIGEGMHVAAVADPDRAEDTDVHCAHQALADEVEAVR